MAPSDARGVEEERFAAHGSVCSEHGGQRFVVDYCELSGIDRQSEGVGDDDGDRLADITNLVFGEQRLGEARRVRRRMGKQWPDRVVLGRKRTHDAGSAAHGAQIDAEVGVGNGRPHEHGVGGPGKPGVTQIIEIGRRARQEQRCFFTHLRQP